MKRQALMQYMPAGWYPAAVVPVVNGLIFLMMLCYINPFAIHKKVILFSGWRSVAVKSHCLFIIHASGCVPDHPGLYISFFNDSLSAECMAPLRGRC